ncbi:MAG: DnaJ domain-containing protein [Ferruginibacter sp.]|nr:DnaJ domain-containing protein [Cytophagales bacterium]
MPDHYQILGVSQTASKEEVKTAFKKLALTLHPDRNPNNPEAEERFKQVSAAYQVLSHDEKRAVYDLKQYYTTLPPPPEPTDAREDQRVPPPVRGRRRRYPANSRARPVSRVEYPPGYERKMTILFGIGFVTFVVALVFFYNYMNRSRNEQLYRAAVAEGKSYSAMLKYSEVLGYDREFWQAYYQRGELRIALLGDYQNAHRDFDAAIHYAEQPTAAMFYNRGLCSYQLKAFDAALTDLDQSLRLDARRGEAYYLRSLTRLVRRDTTGACQDWQNAVRRGVNYPEDSLAAYCR